MSIRLQVLLEPVEFEEIRREARANRQTVSEWVRTTLREARRGGVEEKLRVIREAVELNGPTADIEQMNAEIASGYSTELPE